GLGTEGGRAPGLLGARRIGLAVRGDGDGAADRLRAIEGVRAVTRADGDGVVVFTVEAKEDLRAEVCRALVLAGHDVVRLDESREKLETIFLELVQGRAGDVDHLPA